MISHVYILHSRCKRGGNMGYLLPRNAYPALSLVSLVFSWFIPSEYKCVISMYTNRKRYITCLYFITKLYQWVWNILHTERESLTFRWPATTRRTKIWTLVASNEFCNESQTFLLIIYGKNLKTQQSAFFVPINSLSEVSHYIQYTFVARTVTSYLKDTNLTSISGRYRLQRVIRSRIASSC